MKADMCDLMHFNGHTGYSRTCKEIGMHECQSTCQSNIYTWVVRVAPNIRYCVFYAHISKRTAKSYAINWFDRGTEQNVCHKCMYRHRCWLHAEWQSTLTAGQRHWCALVTPHTYRWLTTQNVKFTYIVDISQWTVVLVHKHVNNISVTFASS